ncbi:hypothetical protein PCL_12679 [Purpureocillium lilacinum]|uniref:Chromo shadow domain-containing protein n=1 Tax=Purpureocillium lilacinum TaxID=33203 RepID=A0A2U3DPC2_PURLI|nr:hypothetical protein PCL_12679 [Purpureocillium lilacinum]
MCRTRTLGARLAEEAKKHQRRAPDPREPAGVARRLLRGVRFLPAAREKGAEEASRREHRLRGAELRALVELLESHDVWTADEEPLAVGHAHVQCDTGRADNGSGRSHGDRDTPKNRGPRPFGSREGRRPADPEGQPRRGSRIAFSKRIADANPAPDGAVHTDIVGGDATADNILVDENDSAWIIDFRGSYTLASRRGPFYTIQLREFIARMARKTTARPPPPSIRKRTRQPDRSQQKSKPAGSAAEGNRHPVNSDNRDNLAEDEFIVEKIRDHAVAEDAQDHLSKCSVLQEYFDQIGGRDKAFAGRAVQAKKDDAGTSSSLSPTTGRRDNKSVAGTTNWEPPPGSWEYDIKAITGLEDDSGGKLTVYLDWKNGRKTKHDTSVIYKKCPQMMLQFYERHVKIIRNAVAGLEGHS